MLYIPFQWHPTRPFNCHRHFLSTFSPILSLYSPPSFFFSLHGVSPLKGYSLSLFSAPLSFFLAPFLYSPPTFRSVPPWLRPHPTFLTQKPYLISSICIISPFTALPYDTSFLFFLESFFPYFASCLFSFPLCPFFTPLSLPRPPLLLCSLTPSPFFAPSLLLPPYTPSPATPLLWRKAHGRPPTANHHPRCVLAPLITTAQ